MALSLFFLYLESLVLMCLVLLHISCLVAFPSFDIVCPTLIGFHLCPIHLPFLIRMILFAFLCHHQYSVLRFALCFPSLLIWCQCFLDLLRFSLLAFSPCSFFPSCQDSFFLFSFDLHPAWHPLNLYIFPTDKHWTNWTYSARSVQKTKQKNYSECFW